MSFAAWWVLSMALLQFGSRNPPDIDATWLIGSVQTSSGVAMPDAVLNFQFDHADDAGKQYNAFRRTAAASRNGTFREQCPGRVSTRCAPRCRVTRSNARQPAGRDRGSIRVLRG